MSQSTLSKTSLSTLIQWWSLSPVIAKVNSLLVIINNKGMFVHEKIPYQFHKSDRY